MITTGCDVCIFSKRDKDKAACTLNQLCVVKDGQVYAPGFCRLCRTLDWAQKQGTRDLEELQEKVADEMSLMFDMLVFFDEEYNSLKDLERTLGSEWYTKHARKVIIVDTTGFGDRKNLALQYVRSREHKIPTVVNSSVEHEPVCDRANTLKRISKEVKAPFFLAISAGNIIHNFHNFALMIAELRSRVIHWSFPFVMGNTVVVPSNFNHGVFITQTYKALVSNRDGKSFSELLREEEETTKMGLSWLCDNVWLI